MVYWEFFTTVDHLVPVARGGGDDENNRVTTSMLHNGAKSNWDAPGGWVAIAAAGRFQAVEWFTGMVRHISQQERSHLSDKYIRRWHRAALAVTT